MDEHSNAAEWRILMKKTILIVDDNEGDRELIREALNELDFDCQIIMADSGEQGIEKAKENKPQIAIIDTRLTGMDGFETCKTIKNLYGDSVKVIVMTGKIDAVDAIRARKMGADDYTVKAMDFNDLVTIVKQLTVEEKV